MVITMSLSACGNDDSAPSDVATAASAGIEFTGPYATRFAEEYDAERTSDFARKILEDGEITEAELAESRDRLEQCFTSHGIELISLDGMEMEYRVSDDVGDDAEEAVTDCEFASGIQPAYYLDLEMRGNPEHVDLATVMVQCFIDRGAVPADYTVDDYERDNVEFTFPFADGVGGDGLYNECLADPLGLINQEGNG